MVCMLVQLTQSNYNVDSSTKSSNYSKIQFKALITLNYNRVRIKTELKPLRIRHQSNLLRISVTSN